MLIGEEQFEVLEKEKLTNATDDTAVKGGGGKVTPKARMNGIEHGLLYGKCSSYRCEKRDKFLERRITQPLGKCGRKLAR